MNYKDIEFLKSTLTSLVKQGCTLEIPSYGVGGRVVGIGFKPYWTNPVDSKVERLELNFMDNYGRLTPFNFYNVTGYDVVSRDEDKAAGLRNICLDIHVYSPGKSRDEEPSEKVRLNLAGKL